MGETKPLIFGVLVGQIDPDQQIPSEDVHGWQDEGLDLLAHRQLLAAGLRHRWPLDDARIHARTREAVALESAWAWTMEEVLAALNAAGIRALLLKGAALAYTVYPQPWLRPRADLDLLVPVGALDRAAAAVAPLGFAPDVEVTDPLLTAQRHLRRPPPWPAALDLHASLVNAQVLRTLPAYPELHAHAVAIPALGPHAFGLSPADALLHALVHRVAHHNSSDDPLWLFDLHLLAGALDDSGWMRLVETARAAAVCAIAAAGLNSVARHLHTTIPGGVMKALEAAPAEPSAALLGGELTEWRLQWINLRALNGFGARCRFLRAHLLPPSAVVTGAEAPWRRPLAYSRRLVRGAIKWMRPIGRGR